MPIKTYSFSVLLLLTGFLVQDPAWSADPDRTLPPVETLSPGPASQGLNAIARSDRTSSNRAVVEMLTRLERLQREVQELRGDVEVQNYNLEGLKQRQRDLYQDIDRRLNQLETGGVAVPEGAPSMVSPPGDAQDRSAMPSKSGSAREAAAYEAAFTLLKEGQYAPSIQAFEAFLQEYPNGSFVPNAQYWLGEANYVTRDFQTALGAFNKLVELYPSSPKVPDALLKTGFIYYETADWKKARETLGHLKEAYPDTTAARLAQQRLERMKKEGH